MGMTNNSGSPQQCLVMSGSEDYKSCLYFVGNGTINNALNL